jgi:phage/plasmid-like protein (TIGR03299 family)
VDPDNINSGFYEAGDSHYVWRPDTRKRLGSVGSTYEVVDNLTAFDILRPLVDEGVLTLETGGVLRDGADAWLMGRWDLEKFGETAREVLGDEVQPYACVLANHNGRRGILLGQTAVRIVCANTLGAAEVGGSSRFLNIAHRTGAREKLAEAAHEVFQGVVERYEVIASHYQAMMGRHLEGHEFRRLVLDIVAPRPDLRRDWNPEARSAESVLERNRQKRAELQRLWREGKGHTGEPTAWYAYNAAVEALDHNRELWPTRSGCYRTASLLTGELGRMKNEVLDGLVSLSMAS